MPAPAAGASPIIEITLELAREDFEEETAAAKAGSGFRLGAPAPVATPADSELHDARFVETVAVVAAVSLAALSKRIVGHWLAGREEGVQIDLRTTPPTVSKVANVPRGVVLLISTDGTSQIKKFDYAEGESLADLLSVVVKRPVA